MALTPLAEANLRIQMLESVLTALIYRTGEKLGTHEQAQAYIKDLEDESFEVLNDGTPLDQERQKRVIALHGAFFKGVRGGL